MTKILRIGCERTSAHMRSSLSAIKDGPDLSAKGSAAGHQILKEYEFFSPTELRFARIIQKNGELLRTAENNGIEVFLTGDQTLAYEQNLAGRAIAIVALSSVEWDILKQHLPLIIAALDKAHPGTFQAVDCGTFTRKK